MQNIIKCRSAHSGDYITTKYGKFRHTNGHWWIEGAKINHDICEVTAGVIKITVAGTPATHGEVVVDKSKLEAWIDEQKTKNNH